MMLQARSAEGFLITLAALTKAEIEQQRGRQTFYCPACNEQVIMKAGPRTIPHFAHKNASSCPSNEGGEGAYHEKGKLLLYLWLKQQQLDVQLEAYLPEIRQRPDIMLTIHDKKIAIEFQCAKVAPNEIRNRNAGYQKIGVIPIWILGASRFRRQSEHRFKIDTFTLQFLHQFHPQYPPSLFYFCPDTYKFAAIRDIYISRTGQAIGDCTFSSIKEMHFRDLFASNTISIETLFRLWANEKERFRLQPRKKRYGKTLAWHQWLYLNGTHIEQLPSIVYLPVQSQFRMKTPLWEWQSRFVIDLLHPLPLGGQISLRKCEHDLRKHLFNKHAFPLINNEIHPIKQYLHQLEKLHMIQQQHGNRFIKTAPISFHKQVEQALCADREIMKQLKLSSLNKL